MADFKDFLASAGAASGNPALAIGGAILGGLFGGQSSTQTQTANREPWGPAQELLKRQIANTGQLQSYYQQNPFNAQQQTSYNNLFGDIDQFRNQVAPGLMGFANNMMGSSYQRARGPVGSGGYGPAPSPMAAQPGPFSLAQGGNFGQVDFGAANPYANGSIKAYAPPVAAAVPGGGYGRDGEGGFGGDYGSTSTPDWGAAYSLAQMTGSPALMGYAVDGMLGSSNGAAKAADAAPSTTTGLAQGYDGPGSNRGGSGGSDVDGGAGNSAGTGNNDGGRDAGTGGGFMAKGGPVTARDVKGPNPAGPDDGFTALQVGEYVIKKSAVNKYGQGLLDAINQGKLPAKALRGLL